MKCVFIQNGFQCALTNVYGPADEILQHSKDFWQELDEVRRKWPDVPWCLGGDFNCILFASEKNRNNRNTTHIKLIDRFIFSGEWEDQFPKATQHLLRRNLSDHHPISLRGG
ncbi:hypothetical protein MKW94_011020, partial [Papaver nudicaule]|nr:hypothetical protein [Papaver nudicaule]